ncbi:5-hydroxytryptamine receptor 3A-like [Watersipora subatra]|uniref:5-hydroxytryptamine receptor 3A-like n=1 Tax=Watersipora subatra TaxID=2589382 RepID=UPI00355B438C
MPVAYSMCRPGLFLFLVLLSSADTSTDEKPSGITLPLTTGSSATKASSFAPKATTTRPKDYGNPDGSFLPTLDSYLSTGQTNNSFHYDIFMRPSPFEILDIYAIFYLTSVGQVKEKEGSFLVSGVFLLHWTDDRLTWDPLQFGNITTAIFDRYKVWIPRFFHSGNKFIRLSDSVLRVDISYDGKVDIFLSVHETVPCLFDMKKFPRDIQHCYFQLYHPDPLIKLHAMQSGTLDFDSSLPKVTTQHVAWEVLEVSMEAHPQIEGTNSGELLIISIEMMRHASFFIKVYVAPICFLLLLIPVIFLLPPDSSEKLTYGAVLLFCMVFVSQVLEEIYPPYIDSTPYFMSLTLASGALLFLCIFLSSIISSAERIGRKRPVPVWLKKYAGIIGPYLLVHENEGSHGTVHIRAATGGDNDYIVHSEQHAGLEEPDGELNTTESVNGDNNQALQALANELKQARLQSKTQDDWTNIFTITNRLLFLLTLLIGIILIFCFA